MSSPIYIEVPDYEDILDEIDDFKDNLVEAKQLLKELHELRSEENKQVYRATEYLKQMDKKLEVLGEEFVS